MLERVVVPSRLALIHRAGLTLGYNPNLNLWELLDETTAEVLRWLRAKRDRNQLEEHLERRFGYLPITAKEKLQGALKWCILRRLLYLDREPSIPTVTYPTHPLTTIYWICTQACNLRCTYCYQEAAKALPNELSTDEGKNLVDQAVEAGAQTFIFTGGEPFFRRDLLEIGQYSRDCGLQTNVITNGHFITKKTVKDVAATFHNVTISLDHGLPEHHDHHRGQGSWEKAVSAIDLLLEAGVNVDINSVLSSFGLHDVKELLQFGQKRHIGEHRIVPQFPMGRGASTRESELTPSEILGVSDQIYYANSDLMREEKKHTKPEGSYSRKMVCRNHCGAGLSEVSIDPEGWVYPCKLLQYPHFRTENIRSHRLVDIIKTHPTLLTARSTTADTLYPCKGCIIKNHCGGGCRGIHFSFTHDYIKAHPLFCAYLRRTFEVQAWASTGDVPTPRRTDFSYSMQPAQTNIIPLSTIIKKS
jgi:radical SAM protein with 4Fe4S-binding SPASM domain